MSVGILRTTQIIGLTTSLFLSGVNAGASYLTLPILFTQPPSVSTPIFQTLYKRGAVSLPPLAVFSSLCSAYLAFALPEQRSLYVVASMGTLAMIPWTLVAMMETNNRLCAIADSKIEQEKVKSEEVEALLRKWTWMNYVRSGLMMVGGLTGLFALIDADIYRLA
jgi:Domain of unknown function (DUF1772)